MEHHPSTVQINVVNGEHRICFTLISIVPVRMGIVKFVQPEKNTPNSNLRIKPEDKLIIANLVKYISTGNY